MLMMMVMTGTHPEKLEILSDCMREVSKAPLYSTDHLVKGYDWESVVGDGVIVDVSLKVAKMMHAPC